ncbi:MAG: methyltransferase, partial [Roseiflexaceae bacterium]
MHDTARWQPKTITVAGRDVTYHTRPGLPAGDAVTPAALWLAQECAKYADPVLCLDVAYALPALVWRARAICVVTRHAGMAASMAQAQVASMRDSSTLAPASFHTVLIEVDPTRELWRQRLLTAWQLLPVGGVLLVAGANDAGGKSAASDINALFGRCHEQSKHHHRLITAIKPATMASQPPWVNQPGVTPGTWVQIAYRGRSYAAQAGVFAHDRVDAATDLLCQHLPDLRGRRVLDLGAGAGILGGVAHDAGAQAVDLIDVDAHAVASMQRTFAGDAGVRVAWGDVLDGIPWHNVRYDVVLSNPPFHAGKHSDDSMVRAFVATAARHLVPTGELWLVANAFLAY